MSYLGRSGKLSLKAQEKVSFLATAGQTSKTGLSYTPSFIEVFVNGVLLTDTTDFTATNGNSITFTVALLLNDEVTVISLKTFTVADHYSKTEADTLLAAKATIVNFTSTGIDDNATSTAVTIDASEDIEAGTYSSSGATNGIKFNLSSNTGRINISSINSTSDMLNFNTTNGEVGSIQAVGSGTIYSTGGTGGGIKLGGTGAANTLDDYETGSWNPTLASSGGTDSGRTYSATPVGTYVKVGKLVTLTFEINCNGAGTLGTGEAVIKGIPFTPHQKGSGTFAKASAFAAAKNAVALSVETNNVRVYLMQSSSESTTVLGYLAPSGWGTPSVWGTMQYTTNE